MSGNERNDRLRVRTWQDVTDGEELQEDMKVMFVSASQEKVSAKCARFKCVHSHKYDIFFKCVCLCVDFPLTCGKHIRI